MKHYLSVLFALCSITIYAQLPTQPSVKDSFPWLEHSDSFPIIWYDSTLAELERVVINEEMKAIYHGEFKLSIGSQQFKITTSGNPDTGPLVVIEYIYNSKESLFYAYCSTIIMPGNGYLYVFNDHHLYFGSTGRYIIVDKYRFEKGEFKLINQPIYPVYFNTTALEQIILFSELELINEVAIIPKDGQMFVIGYTQRPEGIFCLIQTKFGLTGWHRLHVTSDVHKTSIQDVFFSPD